MFVLPTRLEDGGYFPPLVSVMSVDNSEAQKELLGQFTVLIFSLEAFLPRSSACFFHGAMLGRLKIKSMLWGGLGSSSLNASFCSTDLCGAAGQGHVMWSQQ